MLNTEGWKDALRTPAILLACYFIVPPLLNFALGGSPALSYLAQAGFGIAILRKLGALKGPLAEALAARLGRFSQPRERTAELAAAVMFAGGRFAVIALLLSPLAHLLPGWLAVIVTLAAVGYIVYAAHGVWTLYEPFVAAPPEAPEPEAEPEAPAPPERRCPKCGQKLEEGAAACSFCRHPVV